MVETSKILATVLLAVSAGSAADYCGPDPPELTPDLEFGAADEEQAGFLYAPGSVVVDVSGNVFVLDYAQQAIVEFDREGNHLRTFSRSGEGPGELRGAFQMSTAPGGELAVYDPGNRRVTFFDGEGAYLRSFALSEIGYDFVAGFRAGPGGVYMEIQHVDRRGQSEATEYAVVRFSPDLAGRSVLTSARVKDNRWITRPLRTNVPVPFHPGLFWDVAPSGGIVIGDSADYTLRSFSADGKPLRTVRHEGARQPVSAADREAHFAGMTVSDSSGHSSQGAPAYIRQATEFPELKPYFRGLKVDPEGYVLVASYEVEGDAVVYDVFTAGLDFACRTKLPEWFQSATLAGGRLYRVVTDEDGSARVRRYRR